MKLSSAQKRALAKFQDNEAHCAYGVKETLPTLRALVRAGYLKDVTRPGHGGMFSPTNRYQFKIVRNRCEHDWYSVSGLIDRCSICGEERA